jgi:3-deoxy-D-manno-octulosonic-acid transferase
MLKRRFPELLLILAPRHPHRFLEVEKLLRSKKIAYVKRSQSNGQGLLRADVLLLDTMGELPVFYAWATAAFVGGSLIDAGGHNILEPAKLRKPVFFGPFVSHFSEAATEMEQRGGAVMVRNRDDLVREVSRVLADPVLADTMGELAHRVASGNQKVVTRSIELVSRYLDG